MKYTNLILIVIAGMLLMALFKFARIETILLSRNQDVESLVLSQQALIQSNQHLEQSLSSLRSQIETITDKLPKK